MITAEIIRDVIFAELKRQGQLEPVIEKGSDFTDVFLDGRFDLEAVARAVQQAIERCRDDPPRTTPRLV